MYGNHGNEVEEEIELCAPMETDVFRSFGTVKVTQPYSNANINNHYISHHWCAFLPFRLTIFSARLTTSFWTGTFPRALFTRRMQALFGKIQGPVTMHSLLYAQI